MNNRLQQLEKHIAFVRASKPYAQDSKQRRELEKSEREFLAEYNKLKAALQQPTGGHWNGYN